MALRTTFLLVPLILASFTLQAAPPDITLWLWQHPEIANAIAFDFPDTPPALPGAATSVRTAPSPWLQRAGRTTAAAGGISNRPTVTEAAGSTPYPAGSSCPAFIDLPTPGKTLLWCQWPEAYRQRLKSHFERYWTWMEASWPLYQQYKDSGFTVKPAGFDERFASKIDPDTGAAPGTLPFATQFTEDDHTYFLYDLGATIDHYLKITALQLVLDRGPYLGWKLGDYGGADLSLLLHGGVLFEYIPVGGTPYGKWITTQEGYKARRILASPPLATLKFLMNEGMLRTTRFETVSQLLEWERHHLTHLYSGISDEVGECENENDEIIWGFKGVPPLSSVLYGSMLTCTSPPGGGDGTLGYRETTLHHYTRGCSTSGFISHQALRPINIPVEDFRRNATHSQTRFVVEKAPFEAMLAGIEPTLPFEPPLTDAPVIASTFSFALENSILASKRLEPIQDSPSRDSRPRIVNLFEKKNLLANAYLDHNDNPYSIKPLSEIAVRELLIGESTFKRWFPDVPTHLSDEDKLAFRQLHDQRVSFRPTQLRISKLPLYLFQYYCWKDDEGKPHEQTETYKYFFDHKYTPEQLESTGFWTRFDQKFDELGGCEGLPPMW